MSLADRHYCPICNRPVVSRYPGDTRECYLCDKAAIIERENEDKEIQAYTDMMEDDEY